MNKQLYLRLKSVRGIIILLFFAIHLLAQEREFSDIQIIEKINRCRPSKGGVIPKDIKNRLGTTHVDGQYFLTQEPFIIEGAKKVQELGYGVLKLWFGKGKGYAYNSVWNLPESATLKQIAEAPYYKEVFSYPFSCFVLNVNGGFPGANEYFSKEGRYARILADSSRWNKKLGTRVF